MKALIFALVFVLGSTTVSFSQSDREVANAEIANALSDLDKLTPDQAEMMSMSATSLQDRVEAITQRVRQLKQALENNGYVRISGFSLNLPIGVSISFNFIE